MRERIYWLCCVLMVFLAANLVALHAARGDECVCVAHDAAAKSPITATPNVLSAAESFLVNLNAERQKHGLQAVIHSDLMAATAQQNNQWCQAKGLGHHVLNGFGQCAAGPFATMRDALTAWLSSPAHRALILAPDLTMVGYASSGPWHTVATWQGGVQDKKVAADAAPACQCTNCQCAPGINLGGFSFDPKPAAKLSADINVNLNNYGTVTLQLPPFRPLKALGRAVFGRRR